MQQLYGHLLDFGEADLLASGVQEHAWGLRYMDVHLTTTSLVADRLQDCDRMLHAAMRKPDYSLLKYSPAAVLSVQKLVSGRDRSEQHTGQQCCTCCVSGPAHMALESAQPLWH